MKAIRVHEFGDPEVLRLEEVPMPRPGSGEVLVRIHAIGVNPVETYIRAGTYARLPVLPYTPGNDGAGVVEQIGSDVSKFRPGARVYVAGSVSGTYAEFALCKTEQVHRLPENVSFAQGAAMGTPTRRHIAGCSSAPTLRQVKRCWYTCKRRCRDGGGAIGACSRSTRSAPPAVTKDASSRANKARTKCSIMVRRTISSRSCRRPAGAELT